MAHPRLILTVSIIIALTALAIAAITAIVRAIRLGARREESSDLYQPVAASRFTIPVSIILPVGAHPERLARTIRMLMDLTYPEFEVIAIADRFGGEVFERLISEWGLAAKEFFYRHTIETAAVHRIYRSTVDSRLTIVDKADAGPADAINCGVDLARYRYVCTIRDDVEVEADALLRVMSPALWDPANVLAVASHVERRDSNRLAVQSTPAGGPGQPVANNGRDLWTRATAPYQYLSSLRSMMDSRLVWRTLSGGLGPDDQVIVWRRDALVQLGGFSVSAADPCLDMMARLQSAGPERLPGRVVRSPEVFGRAAPSALPELVRRTALRQRAAAETWPAARTASGLAPGVRRQEQKMVAYYLATELATPLLQGWIVAAVLLGVAFGWFSWAQIGLTLMALAFGNAAVGAAALFLRAAAPGAPEGHELTRLLVTAPLDVLLYRPAVAYARVAALGPTIAGLLSRKN